MSAASDALSGQQPDDIQSILAQLNALLTPTEKLPTAGAPEVSVLSPDIMTAAARSGSGAGGAGTASGAPSTLSSLTSILGLAKNGSSLLSSILGTGSLGSAAAADTNAATSAVNSLNVANDGTAGAVEAANDAALGAGVGDVASYGGDIGAAAAADTAAATGDVAALNVANDGTAAAVGASNDAALSAADGGAAGAGAGADGGALAGAGTALGALGTGYSLANEIQSYESGNTGSDAMSGAETGGSLGATIGSVVPGLGTLIGGAAGTVLGGLAGAISSAFGGGENDPETLTWNNIVKGAASNPSLITGEDPSQLYQNLAGIMDAKDNTPGHSTPLELTFGREGEGSFMDAMTNQVNSALKANPSLDSDSASQLYSSVVEPWMQKNGSYVPSTDIVSSNGTEAGNSVNNLLTGLLGDWMNGSINSNSQLGITGQTIGGLSNYIGLTPEELAAISAANGGSAGNSGAAGVMGGIKGLTR